MQQNNASPMVQERNDSQVLKNIDEWKKRLIDLSRRNRLLYFKHTKAGNLTISQPDSETIFNRLVLRKRHMEFWLPPEDQDNLQKKPGTRRPIVPLRLESLQPAPNQLVCGGIGRTDLENILKKLNRRSLLDYRERGVRILHVAFGILTWRELETNEEVRSPLIIVPIELSRASVREPFTISVPPVEEDAVINPALQVRLKNDFKLELPLLPENGESQELSHYFNAVTQAVSALGWKVEPAVEIGLFSFHKLVIYKDLDNNAGLIVRHPVVRAVAGVKDAQLVLDSLPEEKDVDRIESPESTFRVLDADSSQRISIDYALRGQSFVMQGPPGTGKSQTIANIISECIAQGKSVLFVSDKMAALEVVYKRLNDVGLAPFCLELHSSKANKQEVVAELKRCLNEQLIPRKLPSPYEFEKLKDSRDALNGYVSSLHKKQPNLQKSAYEVLGELSALEQVPTIPVGLTNISGLTPQKMHELEELMSQLKSVWQVVEEAEFPWRGYRQNSYTLETRSELSTFLENLISAISLLKLEATKIAKKIGVEAPSNFDQVDWLIKLCRLLAESPKPEANWVTHPSVDKLIEEARAYEETCSWCRTTRNQLMESYEEPFLNVGLNKSMEVEQAVSKTKEVLLPDSVEDGELLKKQKQILSFAEDTQVSIKSWTEHAKELAQLFGLSAENLTAERVSQLSRIAFLCFSDDKPESSWFDPAFFQRVQNILPQAKQDFQEYSTLKTQVRQTFTDRIYELDLDELVRRYRGLYRSFLKWFRPSYYDDRERIAGVTYEGREPKSPLKDLVAAQRVKTLRGAIDAYSNDLQSLLGHFYQGYGTDFQKVEKAVAATTEILELTGLKAVPDGLIKLVSHGSRPNEMVNRLGAELEESMRRWNQQIKELSSVIPTSPMPNSNLSIYKMPLDELQGWAYKTETRLTFLQKIAGEALETRKNEEEPKSYRQFIDDLKTAEAMRKKEAEFLGEQALLKTIFGFRFVGLDTDWKEIIAVLEWTRNLQALFGSTRIPDLLVNTVTRGATQAPSVADLTMQKDETVKLLAALESRFEPESAYQSWSTRMRLDYILTKTVRLRDRVDDLQVWVDFKDMKNAFSLKGLDGFFSRLTEGAPPASQLVDIFRKGAYQEWINNLYGEDASLGRFRRENHEQLITEFRKLDRELIHLSSNMAIEEANKRKPQDILIQATDTEISVLLKEAAKKRRLMPIRNLLQRIPHLLPKLKPCLLMSPISVSQFLPPELMKFDLVLFDEASQIVPEDAIGAFYRGKCMVVAGDNKQLPPTSFFQKSLIEDIDWDEMKEGEVEVFDSILDECMGIGLPVKTLRWHYRSRHESLIAFSNKRFYDDSLITFPSAVARHEALGVKLVYVKNGVYDRGGRRDNPKEAEVVSNLVFDHFRKYPNKTLGVVTFSLAQMETVEEALERRLREQPEFEHFFKEDRLEGFFVKNLENVQGDERDAIIFSVGYGYDQGGLMTMNFGPLNKVGGERRLNVAVTRAREKVVLVGSIKSSDIDVTAASAAGVSALHDYLEYAEKNHETTKTQQQASKFDSPLEDEVAEEIRRMDYNVDPKVGYSVYPIDIGVVDPANPGCYLLGIECDGSTYRASNSARDRDRLREQVLTQLGWQVHRIWSPDWVARRESEVRRLKDAIDQACQRQTESSITRTDEELKAQKQQELEYLPETVEVRQVQFGGVEKIGVPYKVHVLNAIFNPYVKVPLSRYPYSSVQKNEFHLQENRVLQSRFLEELVREEGPIHFDYAVQRLAASWGLRRTGPKVVYAVKEALEMLIQDHRITVKGDFLWPNDLVEVPLRVPVQGRPESMRSPEHIPPEEIENAIRLVAQYALSISEESLITETGKVFGFSHASEKTKERIRKVYKKMLRERKLANANNKVTLS